MRVEIYSDASLIDRNQMGIGWILKEEYNPEIINIGNLTVDPKKPILKEYGYHAPYLEIQAIIMLIEHYVTKGYQKIKIYTDNQSAVDGYFQTYNENGKRVTARKMTPTQYMRNWVKIFKQNYPEIIITLHKVKAHADNRYNEYADILARKGAMGILETEFIGEWVQIKGIDKETIINRIEALQDKNLVSAVRTKEKLGAFYLTCNFHIKDNTEFVVLKWDLEQGAMLNHHHLGKLLVKKG